MSLPAIDLSGWAPRVARPALDGDIHISGRRIYILPTRYGFMFAGLLLAMLVGAVNYANNPAFLLTFLLAGLGTNTIYYTWRNLVNLSLRWQGARTVFAGEQARFDFLLDNPTGHDKPAVQLVFKDDGRPTTVSLAAGTQAPVHLAYQTSNRGSCLPGRLIISTSYPLGMFRAWCYVETQAESLVYPEPGAGWQPVGAPDYKGSDEGDLGVGTDDFVGLRGYRPGDSPRHIDWKALAAERGLLTKQFGGDRADQTWLDWYQLNNPDTEQKLSLLCRGVLDAEAGQHQYGLRLPDLTISPGRGPAHRHACLRALALFGHSA